MAQVATAENVTEQEVNFDHLIDNLSARINAQKPMTEAKSDYDGLCKAQNEKAGYNKKAMNWLTGLAKMSPQKFNDTIRTLQPGLEMLVAHRSAEEPEMELGDDNVKPFQQPE